MMNYTFKDDHSPTYLGATEQFSIELGILSETEFRLPGIYFASEPVSDVEYIYIPFGRFIYRLSFRMVEREERERNCLVERLSLPLDLRAPGRAQVINRVTAHMVTLGNMTSTIEPYGFIYHHDSDQRWDGPKHSVFNDINEQGTIAGSYGDRPYIFRVNSGRILATGELPTPWTDPAEAISIDKEGKFALGLRDNELVYWTLESTGWNFRGRASEGTLPASSRVKGLAIHSMRDRWIFPDSNSGAGLYGYVNGSLKRLREFPSTSGEVILGDSAKAFIGGFVHDTPQPGPTVLQYIKDYFDPKFPEIHELRAREFRTWEVWLDNWSKNYTLLLVQADDGAVKCFVNCTWKRE